MRDMRRNIFLDPKWDLKKKSSAEDFVFMKDFEYKTDALRVVEAMASLQRDSEKSASVVERCAGIGGNA